MNKYSFIFLLFILLSLGSVFAINSSFFYFQRMLLLCIWLQVLIILNQLKWRGFGELWRYSIDLEPGEYLYKYIIDGEEILDFQNSNITVFNGEVFNVRVVKEPYSFPKTGDGRVKEIYFRNERRYINPVKPGEIYLAIEFEKK